jgi:hypothetical protein
MQRGRGGMDRHLQRIMDDAAGVSDGGRSASGLNYTSADTHPAEYSFQPASRQNEDPMLLNELGKFPLSSLSSLARLT